MLYYKIIFKSKQHKHCVKSCAGKKRKIFFTWKKVEQLYNKQNKVYDEKKKKHNLMHTYVRCEKNKKHFSSILFCFLHKLNNNYILLSIFFSYYTYALLLLLLLQEWWRKSRSDFFGRIYYAHALWLLVMRKKNTKLV